MKIGSNYRTNLIEYNWKTYKSSRRNQTKKLQWNEILNKKIWAQWLIQRNLDRILPREEGDNLEAVRHHTRVHRVRSRVSEREIFFFFFLKKGRARDWSFVIGAGYSVTEVFCAIISCAASLLVNVVNGDDLTPSLWLG